MAAPSGKYYGVGLRHARVYVLDANGVPDAPDEEPYIGLQTVGAKAYELTIPDARRIAHTGDDTVLAQDVLPRLEVSSGTLRVARLDHDVFAALTNTTDAEIGESKIIGFGTNKQGLEPSIAALLYQQAKDADSGVRKWAGYILPSSQAVINPATLNENAPEFQFSLLPSASAQYPWGIAFDDTVEGFTRAELLGFETDNLPMICAWLQTGVLDEFDFPEGMFPVSGDKVHAVAVIETDGEVTDVTATTIIDEVAGTLTLSGYIVAPADAKIVCWYEYAA